jgi:hypothetical protein
MQLYNFKKALASLQSANDLNHHVVSIDYVNTMEAQMATWTMVGEVGAVGTQIVDAYIWSTIMAGFTEAVQAQVGNVLGIKPALARPLTRSEWLWSQAKFLWDQVNPMRGIISVEAIVNNGLRGALKNAARTTLKSIRDDAVRDEFLVKRARMDPAVADRLAGFFWAAVDETVKMTAQKAHDKLAQTTLYKQAAVLYYTKQLKEMQAGLQPAKTINAVLDDPNAWFFQKWLARRRAMAIAEAIQLQQEIDGLKMSLAATAVEAGRGTAGAKAKKLDPDSMELGRLVSWAKSMEVARLALDPETVNAVVTGHGFDINTARQAVNGELGEAERKKVAEEAGALLRVFDGRFDELAVALADEDGWKDNAQRRVDLLQDLDLARRTLHFETFNKLREVVGSKDEPGAPAPHQGDLDDVLRRADVFYATRAEHDPGMTDDKAPSKVVSRERLQQLLTDIVGIVPTGSGGYIDVPDGEYKAWTSDLDYTMVINKKRWGAVTPEERVALECMLQSCFSHVSGGLDPRSFDIAFMVDERPKFTGETSVMKTPQDLTAELKRATLQEMNRVAKEHEEAIDGLLKDASHGERYLTLDRIRALVYLNSLGQDVIYRDKNGRLVKAKKKDLMRRLNELPEDVQKLVKNPQARLDASNAVGIIADDAAMLYAKIAKLNKKIDDTHLDRKPFDDFAKELDKRAIRILLGFLTTDPDALRELNALPDTALRTGQAFDHSTFCEIAIRHVQRMETKHGQAFPKIREVIEGWQQIKMGKFNADDLVRQKLKLAAGAPLPKPSDPKYRTAFKAVVADTQRAIGFMTRLGFQRGAKELTPLFAEQKKLRAVVNDPAFAQRPLGDRRVIEARLRAVEGSVKLKLTGLAALYDKLGPQQKALKDALGSIPDYEAKEFDAALDEVRKRRVPATTSMLLHRLRRLLGALDAHERDGRSGAQTAAGTGRVPLARKCAA